MSADSFYRTLKQAVVGFCVALAASVAGAWLCGGLPYDPEDLRKINLNGRNEVIVGVLIVLATSAVALVARFTAGALVGSAVLVACGLVALGELAEVGGYTAVPVLAAALLVSVVRAVLRPSSARESACESSPHD
jgi:hypothetical protein